MLRWAEARLQTVADHPRELGVFRDDLGKVLNVAPLDHEAAAVRVRVALERLVRDVHRLELGDPKSKPLFDCIEALREKGKIPPRIASYFHTVRRVGDDAAHSEIGAEDLLACLLPLLLVVEWYFCAFEKGPRCASIYGPGRRDEPLEAAAVEEALEHADLIERLVGLAEQAPRGFTLDLWVELEFSSITGSNVPGTTASARRFQLGDRAAICVRADRDCHLWVIDVGTTGRVSLAFPRGEASENRIRAHEVVRIPGRLVGRTGLETVHAFATLGPLLPSASTARLAAHAPVERRVRDFLVDEEVAVRSGRDDCAAATIHFSIVDGRRVGEIAAADQPALLDELARERIAATESLDRALRAVAPSDLVIAEAAELAHQRGVPPSDPVVVARCKLALRRRDLIRGLERIPMDIPVDEQDAQWLTTWNAELLDDCPDAAAHRHRYRVAIDRSTAFAELEQALAEGDARLVRRLVADPRLAGHPGLARHKPEIDALVSTGERLERLLGAVQSDDVETFLAEADRDLLADHASTFVPVCDRIVSLVEGLFRRESDLEPPMPAIRIHLSGKVSVRWNWSGFRLVQAYLVAVDPARFLDSPRESRQDVMRIDRADFERNQGMSLQLPTGWKSLYVTVWPAADLGWTVHVGPPQRLGPIVTDPPVPIRSRGGGSPWFPPPGNVSQVPTRGGGHQRGTGQAPGRPAEQPHRGPVPEASVTGRSEPPDRVPPPPERFDAPLAPAPGSVLRRHTDVSFPSAVPVGKVHNLRVQIVPTEVPLASGDVRKLPLPHPHDVTLPLVVPEPANPGELPPPIKVTVSVAAENLAIEGEPTDTIEVPLWGKSAAINFPLRGLAVGPGRVMIDFTHAGRPLGSVDLNPEVVERNRPEGGRSAAGQGELSISESAPAPDVVIKVFELRLADRPGRLHFVMSSADPRLRDLPILDGDLGTLDLHSEVAPWVDQTLRTLGDLARRHDSTAEEVGKALCEVGYRLFDQVLPATLRDLSWTFRERGVRSVLILSDEPHIPWELIKPYRLHAVTGAFESEDEFWGEAYTLTHWLRGRPPAGTLSFRQVCAVATIGADPSPPGPGRPSVVTRDFLPDSLPEKSLQPTAPSLPRLEAAVQELAMLRMLESGGAQVKRLSPRKRDVQDAIERGGFGLFHVVAHGAFGGPASADASAVLFDDGLFSAADLSPRMVSALRSNAPLFFFNACHSGRIGFSLTRLGSWGARFIELGCGGFIGPLWPVTDEAALAFAREFYSSMMAGTTIGEAMLLARRRVRQLFPNDPSWLAYCCFADPMARISSPAIMGSGEIHRPGP